MVEDVYKKVMKVLWIILFANLGVAVIKIILGTMIKSAGMMADGFHSLTDGSSNIVGLVGIKFASKPVDEEHPYGHKKYETLSGLFIGGMLFFIGGKIIIGAIGRFVNPVTPIITFESMFILLATLCINTFVCIYEYKKGRTLKSQILITDSIHTRSDIYVSIGILMTLLGVKIGLPSIIDPIASLIVAGFIIHAAYVVFKDNINILMDKAVVNIEKIKNITLSFEEVKEIHNIRSRGSENDVHIDMHILTEPNMSVEESHKLIHSIEDKIREEINNNVQVIAHIEPFIEDESQESLSADERYKPMN